MIYPIARKILFCMDPERAHDLSLTLLQRGHRLSRAIWKMPELEPRVVAGLTFPNPVGLSAGLDKNGDYIDAMAALGFGFIEIGTVTPLSQPGNPKPRMFRLTESEAIINRLGFNNKGVDYLVERVKKTDYDGVLGINIGKNKDTPNDRAIDDYLIGLDKVHAHASYVTVNISSPNTQGLRDLQQADALEELLKTLIERKQTLDQKHGRAVPLGVKIAPDLEAEEIEQIADVFNRCRPDLVLATNTTIDHSSVAHLPDGQQAGGLSGAPLRTRATEVLRSLRQQLSDDIPLIGIGGIVSAESALDKFEAGADLIQIYTGLIYHGPPLIQSILKAAKDRDSQIKAR